MIIELLLVAASIQSKPTILSEAPDVPPPLSGTPAEQCRQGFKERRFAEAVEPCRAAVEAAPGNLDLLETAARVEFEADNGAESAALWSRVLEQGWTLDASRNYAMALWRGGDPETAGKIFRENFAKAPSPETLIDLMHYLLSFERYSELIELADENVQRFPKTCEIDELRGAAEALEGRHGEAAAAYTRAIEKGCPPWRWTAMGTGAAALDNPAYRPLLDPKKIVEGLSGLDDDECLFRLTLLERTMSKEAVPAVLDAALHRTKARIRLAALGLLARIGSSIPDAWETLLSSDDFILRKYTLRRIVALEDPAFIPLLEAQRERETTRGNRSIIALGLGGLFLNQDKTAEAVKELESIPEEDPLFVKARLELADIAHDAGDLETELKHLERARDAAPDTFLETDRIEQVRTELEAASNAKPTPSLENVLTVPERQEQN